MPNSSHVASQALRKDIVSTIVAPSAPSVATEWQPYTRVAQNVRQREQFRIGNSCLITRSIAPISPRWLAATEVNNILAISKLIFTRLLR